MKHRTIEIEYDRQNLYRIMWLAYAKLEINKAGGTINMEKLSEMTLLEFAEICGSNDIKLTYDQGCFS